MTYLLLGVKCGGVDPPDVAGLGGHEHLVLHAHHAAGGVVGDFLQERRRVRSGEERSGEVRKFRLDEVR